MSRMSRIFDVFYQMGRADALALRNDAATLTGTQIIDREAAIPDFDPTRDYTNAPVGTPVADEGQVWLLIQPHNPANYQGRPATLRALWGLAHTTNPERAKPWVDAYGTSGMYMTGEVYRANDGTVYRALQDNLVHDHDALPGAWETVGEETGAESEDTSAEEWPEFVQPQGAHDAYYNGDKITFEGAHYVCTAPEGTACVWSPAAYPAYWEQQA